MTNRITVAFGRMEKQIAERIKSGKTTQKAVDSSHSTLDMDLLEYAKFQEYKSLAVAENVLTIEEGMTVYNCLGNSLDVFNRQPVYVKSILTVLFRQLLEKHLA